MFSLLLYQCSWMEFLQRFTGLGRGITFQVISLCICFPLVEMSKIVHSTVLSTSSTRSTKCSPKLSTPRYPEQLMRTRMKRVRDHQNKNGSCKSNSIRQSGTYTAAAKKMCWSGFGVIKHKYIHFQFRNFQLKKKSILNQGFRFGSCFTPAVFLIGPFWGLTIFRLCGTLHLPLK